METNKTLDADFVKTLSLELQAKSDEITAKKEPKDEEIAEALAADDILNLLNQTANLEAIRHHLNESIKATTICTGTNTPGLMTKERINKNNTPSFFHWWRKIHLSAKHFYLKIQTKLSLYEVTHASL